MTPVQQTRLGERGNCLSACMVSLLNLPIEQLDMSCADYEGDGWIDRARELLRPHGFDLVHARKGSRLLVGEAPYIAHGTRRYEGQAETMRPHACIYRSRELVHDPHPDGLGLLDHKIDAVSLLVPMDAARLALPIGRTSHTIANNIRRLEAWLHNRRHLDNFLLTHAIEYLREYERALGGGR